MAVPSAVSKEMVFEIASNFLARDETPTVSAVQREIGERTGSPGSTNVVGRMLKEWRAMAAQRISPAPRTRPDTPQELVALADKLSDAVFELALQRAEDAFAEDRKAMDKQHLEMIAEMDKVKTASKETQRLMASTQKDLAIAAESLAKEQSRSAAFEARLEVAISHESELKARIAQLIERVTHLESDKERLQAEHASQIAEENARHLGALESERTAWRGERTHLHEQTDRMRQSSKERETDLATQLASQTGFADQYRAQALAANQAAGKWQGQVEALSDQAVRVQAKMDGLQRQLSEVAEQKVRAEARAERHEEEIALLNEKIHSLETLPQTDC